MLPLLTADHEVTVASRWPHADPLIRDAGATPVRLDPFDARALARVADQARPEAVVRLATHIPTGAGALVFTVVEGQVTRIDGIRNPDKLAP